MTPRTDPAAVQDHLPQGSRGARPGGGSVWSTRYPDEEVLQPLTGGEDQLGTQEGVPVQENSGLFKLMGFQLRAKLQNSRNQFSNLKPGLTEIFYYIRTLLEFQISNSLCSF